MKTHISIRRATAIRILHEDDVDGEFDYDTYTDGELYDAFVGAGYFSNEEELLEEFVLDTPAHCVDAEEALMLTGNPTDLESYFELGGE